MVHSASEYILQFARILGFCLAGEALHSLLPMLPIPASIYGLLLLFLALETGLVKLEQVKAASAWLIAVFPIMFVPGTVGAMELAEVMLNMIVPILLAVFAITAIVFVVTGHVTQGLLFLSGYAAQTMEQRRRSIQQRLHPEEEKQGAKSQGKQKRQGSKKKGKKEGRK